MQIINTSIKDKIRDFILNVYWRKKDILNFCKNNICENFTCYTDDTIKRENILENFFNFIDTSHLQIEYYKKIISILKEWNFNENDHWYKEGKLNFSIAKAIQIDLMALEINDKKQKNKDNKQKLLSIDMVKHDFYSMIADNNLTPQQKGFEFEKIFYQIAELEEIEYKKPFRILESMEQIDGSLKIENNNYLIELKLTKDEVNFSTLSAFYGKLSTKGCYPRGIFLSMEGFTDGALLNNFSSIYKNIILMDSNDFMNILEGRIKLNELIINKVEHFQTKGYFYYDPVNNINKCTFNLTNK